MLQWVDLYVLSVMIGIPLAAGSAGDRDFHFSVCVDRCSESCVDDDLPLTLQVLGWSCEDNCKYECMQNITKEIKQNGGRILQYYGKWPFKRLFGIQEPASVMFSFFNLLSHAVGMRMLSCLQDVYKFSSYGIFKINCFVNIHAWIWAMAFHTRDLIWTERMDYFAASAVVMFSSFVSITRIIGSVKDIRSYVSGAVLLVLFVNHIYYMNFVKFDYGYNIKFSVFLGAVNVSLWLLWCILNRRERPYVWRCAAVVMGAFLSVGLVVFDFPPIFDVFDAHSLWHLSTAPLTYYWYCFLVIDARYEIDKSLTLKLD